MKWWLLLGVFGKDLIDSFNTLSDELVLKIQKQSNPELLQVTGATLAPFLVPRVAGTPENSKVQEHLISIFEKMGWDVEKDRFEDDTPFGRKVFTNLIATHNPRAPRKLVFAAHFDSKYFKEFEFIGATDSSVPCAILVDLAQSLTPYLPMSSISLQFIFFDGEEAFVEWTNKDSIYGARHLAKKWSNTMIASDRSSQADFVTPLQQIDAFILLDLLGTDDVSIPNTHPETAWLFDRLVMIQDRLADLNLLSKPMIKRVRRNMGVFLPGQSQYGPMAIADDHRPFYDLGVKVLHCIPIPFPQVWHTKDDNALALNHGVIVDISLMFKVLVAEYLGLVGL